MDGLRHQSTSSAGTLPGASGDAGADYYPREGVFSTQGQVPLRNPFAVGDWGAAETLPLLDELFDDYSHIDYR